MDGRPKPWRDPPPRDPDAAAARLRLRFWRTTNRVEWRIRRKRVRRMLGILAAASIVIASASLILAKLLSPWPVMTTMQHLAAFPGCSVARAIGAAPAYRGQPGYWAWQDPDGDGLTCQTRVRAAEPGVYRIR
jgi:hypothetical protein